MSLMKQYKEDTEWLTMRAMEAAWLSDPVERAESLSMMFRDCGTLSLAYHSPIEVAAKLTQIVAETYATEFMAQREGKAA